MCRSGTAVPWHSPSPVNSPTVEEATSGVTWFGRQQGSSLLGSCLYWGSKLPALHLAFSQPLGVVRPPPQPSLALLSSHGLPYKPSGKHTPLASLYISVSPEAKKQTCVSALGELRALPCNKAVMEPRPHLLLEGKEESFGPCS